MKAWICYTLGSLFGPTQGAARVYAYLKTKGYNINLKDFNQNTFFSLLSKKYLEMAIEKIVNPSFVIRKNKVFREEIGSILINGSNRYIKNLIAKGIADKTSWFQYIKNYESIKLPILNVINYRINPNNILFELLNEREFILSEIDKAREILDRKFLNLGPKEFLECFKVLLCGKALIDSAYFPSQLDFKFGFFGGTSTLHTKNIVNVVKDERCNYLIPYYKNEVMPLLNDEAPEVVGISITHPFDFIPALTLANLIKSINPQVHICLGGASITQVAHRIAKNINLWNFFDSMVLGAGEYAFGKLIECIESKCNLSSVPNLVYKEKDIIKKSEITSDFDINDACTPEYNALRPKSILHLETSIGCYWGKCIFCYFPRQGKTDFNPDFQKNRYRKIELIMKDVQKLKDLYDPIYIAFTDSTLSPRRIEQIADNNPGNNKKIYFIAFIRFEKEFTSLSFCEKLVKAGFLGGHIGLESGSQRINNIIEKGVDLNDARIIIQNFNKAGLLIHLHVLVGMPQETIKEALMTFKFLKKWHKLLYLDWTIHPFSLIEHGSMFERANELGIKIRSLPHDFLVQTLEFETKEGLSQEESNKLTIQFEEKLKHSRHPLYNIMSVEMYRSFIVTQKAKGINPNRLVKIAKKII